MNELALFSGAGGGLLASHLLGWNTLVGVEAEPSAASILISRQNDGTLEPFPIWDDVRTFDGYRWRGLVDVLSGGFPCQAWSTASHGKITAKDLWPEMRRIIGECEPRYVFAENTSKEAINKACDDLEEMGYKTKAISLSAADLGGDHIRRRFWVLAYTHDKSELLRGLNAKMAIGSEFHHSVWEGEPWQPRVVDGVARRVDRYRATGNGQVPIVAIAALFLMASDYQ